MAHRQIRIADVQIFHRFMTDAQDRIGRHRQAMPLAWGWREDARMLRTEGGKVRPQPSRAEEPRLIQQAQHEFWNLTAPTRRRGLAAILRPGRGNYRRIQRSRGKAAACPGTFPDEATATNAAATGTYQGVDMHFTKTVIVPFVLAP